MQQHLSRLLYCRQMGVRQVILTYWQKHLTCPQQLLPVTAMEGLTALEALKGGSLGVSLEASTERSRGISMDRGSSLEPSSQQVLLTSINQTLQGLSGSNSAYFSILLILFKCYS